MREDWLSGRTGSVALENEKRGAGTVQQPANVRLPQVCVARQSAVTSFIYAAVNNTVGYPVCTLVAQSLIAAVLSLPLTYSTPFTIVN